MTVEEAIKIVRGESVGYPVSCDEQVNAAKCVADYAEKHLKQKEIWKKVKQEIKDLDLGFVDKEYRAGVSYGIMKTTQIINKHLKEVEDADSN